MNERCIEHKELSCKNYPRCYGCNSFKSPTNFDRIKDKILRMNISDFIDFCGGNSCANVICKEIEIEHAHCKGGNICDCDVCIREYLEAKDT